jgi:hypothetical protein
VWDWLVVLMLIPRLHNFVEKWFSFDKKMIPLVCKLQLTDMDKNITNAFSLTDDFSFPAQCYFRSPKYLYWFPNCFTSA